VEYKVVSQEAVISLPDSLSFEEGATIPCAALTAWTSLSGPMPIRAGPTVLTLGSGGGSIFALQLSKVLGAHVIATTSSPSKAEKLSALGADEVINYKDVPEWGERVRELTGGRGVDRVIEVGGPATINQSLRAVVAGGEIADIGFLSTENPGIDYFKLKATQASIHVITVGDRQGLEDVTRAIATSRLQPVIDHIFRFEDIKEAFAHLKAAAFVGKIVIQMPEEA
jgi:NADPH:quinone reductase-like Zn-dependent oxidoreductase